MVFKHFFRCGSLFYARGVNILLYFSQQEAITRCKISRQSDEKTTFLASNRCYSHRSVKYRIILTSLLPPIQSRFSKFWAWSCIAANFDNGWRGITRTRSWTGHLSQNTVVSQVLLQLHGCTCSIQPNRKDKNNIYRNKKPRKVKSSCCGRSCLGTFLVPLWDNLQKTTSLKIFLQNCRVAALPKSLHEVELDSPLCNTCSQHLSQQWHVHSRGYYTGRFFV